MFGTGKENPKLKTKLAACLAAMVLVLGCSLPSMAQPTINEGVLSVGTDLKIGRAHV